MAGPIPKSFINDLLTQCDIVEIVNHLIPLKKKGSNYLACCPFHEESTPSFTVSPVKQIYHCFGCGVGGSAVNFIMAYQKLEFIPAIEWLANHLHIPIPKQAHPSSASQYGLQTLYQSVTDTAAFYHQQLMHSDFALRYLKKRGITDQSIQHFRLGLAPSSWNALTQFLTQEKNYSVQSLKTSGLIIEKNTTRYYDRFRSRLIFPIRDRQGNFIGLGGRTINEAQQPKYLNSPETPIFHKSQVLYGLYESYVPGKTVERIWIVEGYLDAIMLYQHNITPVAATLGTALTRTHLQQLFRLTQEVIFCFDGDAAGQKAATRALEISLSYLQDEWNIRFLLLPNGHDPDSWLRQSTEKNTGIFLQRGLTIENFLFQYTQQALDLHTVEGERQFLQRIIPLMKKIPPGIRQAQLFHRLSRFANIEIDTLKQLPQGRQFLPQKTNFSQKKYTVLDRAVGLLLQYPKVLSNYLSRENHLPLEQEYPVLKYLIQLVQRTQNVQTAILIEYFRSKPKLTEHLTQLAHHNWLIPEEGVVEEFKDILIHLNKLTRDKKINHLLQKAKTVPLTTEEKEQLTQWLRERH